ncbi:MAG: sodium/glutamate symporter [Acidobacteriota bacterium]|nr:sodium/glutamate symporter [Acidobacteriota bacterium]
MSLDLIQTVALAGMVLFAGYFIRRIITPLATYNIPAPVVGGLMVALLLTLNRSYGGYPIAFDTTLQSPLMIAFFTSIGFGASVALLRVGGAAVLIFFLFSSAMAILQNVIGAGLAMALGQHPLMGVLAGSVTLTGGPATGLAFAPAFEQAGVPAATTIAVVAAMGGIVAGGLIGGPVGTWLVRRSPDARTNPTLMAQPVAHHVVEAELPPPAVMKVPEGEDAESYDLLKSIVVILAAMWIGSWMSRWLVELAAGAGVRLILPAYIGAMFVAAIIRNIDDVTGIFGLSQRTLDDLGNVALSLFIVMALMTLRLWELVGLATPILIMLLTQVIAVALMAMFLVWRLMGKNYEAAVMSSGFVGFMLGTTANAMANMTSLVERYGPAPRAFLVVPMVGAFFIDFTNAAIITAFLNYFS